MVWVARERERIQPKRIDNRLHDRPGREARCFEMRQVEKIDVVPKQKFRRLCEGAKFADRSRKVPILENELLVRVGRDCGER